LEIVEAVKNKIASLETTGHNPLRNEVKLSGHTIFAEKGESSTSFLRARA
jgi:hypothetical protein